MDNARPNPRLQRTGCRPPLSRQPLGSSKVTPSLWFLIVTLLACAASSCAPAYSERHELVAWCPNGSRVSFGDQHLHGMSVSVAGKLGPLVDAAVRWRKMNSDGEWREGATNQDGDFAVTDQQDGEYQLEVCARGYRPISGVVVINHASPSFGFTLFARSTDGK